MNTRSTLDHQAPGGRPATAVAAQTVRPGSLQRRQPAHQPAAGRPQARSSRTMMAQSGDVRRAEIGAVADHRRGGPDRRPQHVNIWIITVWLWMTVVFANLAEAVAEGRGRAQAAGAANSARSDTRGPPAGRRRRSDRCRRRSCTAGTRSWLSTAGDVDPRATVTIVDGASPVCRRVRDHRGVRAGDPRVRWRPVGGDRRDQGAVSDRIVVRITAEAGQDASWTG